MGKIVDGIYYDSNGNPASAGIVELDGKFYYAGENGEIVKNRLKVVHSAKVNGLVKHGTYYFDKNGVLIPSTYKKPRRTSGKNKKDKKRIKIGVIAFVIGIVVLFISGLLLILKTPRNTSKKADASAIMVTVPDFKEEVYLCTKQLESYYKGESTLQQVLASNQNPYKPFVFQYTVKNADSAVLLLGQKSDCSDGVKYILDLQKSKISIDNLKTGTQYYFKLTAINNSKEKKEVTGSFKTANTNRFINLPGLYNTRDIGGYETVNHKRVRQGILIRGTEADGLVESEFYLIDRKYAEPFGFVCDFDLRNQNIFNTDYVSRFGSKVVHKFYNSPQYGEIFIKDEEKTLYQIFSDLADKHNYPMYFHCTYGADRTGTILFLLQGLLGVSEEDMIREYRLTGLVFQDHADAQNIQPIINGLEGVPGKTINEKIYNYITGTIGVSEKQIENIRAIFLE